MLPQSHYYRDYTLKQPVDYSFIRFQQCFDPTQNQLGSLLLTPDQREILSQYSSNPFKWYPYLLPLVIVPFYNRIPILKRFPILSVPIRVISVIIPFSISARYKHQMSEGVQELYELKRKQFRLYKLTGDIKYMNRFLQIVEE